MPVVLINCLNRSTKTVLSWKCHETYVTLGYISQDPSSNRSVPHSIDTDTQIVLVSYYYVAVAGDDGLEDYIDVIGNPFCLWLQLGLKFTHEWKAI